MRRFLVTGGSGFIGSNFLHYWLGKYPDIFITNLDKLTYAGNRENTKSLESKSNYKFVYGDICDAKLVHELTQGIDCIVHFAAETHVDRSIDSGADFVLTNAVGTNALLEASRLSGVKKFIHFSTDEVYGSRREGSFKETDGLDPTSPYSAAKAASDLLALAYWKTHDVPVVVMRSSNNFGPFQYPEKVIPLFITNLIEGKKVPLYAKGENVRDWIHVSDTIKGIEVVIQKGQCGEIYNLGGNSEVSNIELTRAILEEFGKGEDSIEYVTDRLAHDFRYSIDSSKLGKLGYSVKPNFRPRLKETVEWYQNHESWWKPLKADRFTQK